MTLQAVICGFVGFGHSGDSLPDALGGPPERRFSLGGVGGGHSSDREDPSEGDVAVPASSLHLHEAVRLA